MSMEAIIDVWQHSRQKGSRLLVMLALANYAHPETGEIFPSQSTLANKVRLKERYVRGILDDLEAAGEIERDGRMKKGVVKWRITYHKPRHYSAGVGAVGDEKSEKPRSHSARQPRHYDSYLPRSHSAGESKPESKPENAREADGDDAPASARDDGPACAHWNAKRSEIVALLGDDLFSKLVVESDDGERVVLNAPTRFLSQLVATEHAEGLQGVLGRAVEVRHCDVKIRSVAQKHARIKAERTAAKAAHREQAGAESGAER